MDGNTIRKMMSDVVEELVGKRRDLERKLDRKMNKEFGIVDYCSGRWNVGENKIMDRDRILQIEEFCESTPEHKEIIEIGSEIRSLTTIDRGDLINVTTIIKVCEKILQYHGLIK